MTALQRTAAASRRVIAIAATFSFSFYGGYNINLRTQALAAGWNGLDTVAATVTGIIGSHSVGTPALVINGAFPGSVNLTINSGAFVVGMGGSGIYVNSATLPQSGGPAISVSVPVSITNNGIIGGGGGAGSYNSTSGSPGGGGAGQEAGGGYNDGANFAKIQQGGNGGPNSAGGGPGSPGSNMPNNGTGLGAGGGGLGASGGRVSGSFTEPGDGPDGDQGFDANTYSQSTNGGFGGAAVLGAANVAWTNVGVIYGAVNS